jgi:transcriptional regulator with XRE-family HTH domain
LDIYQRIGERIRRARQRARLTQPQLAQLLGVSKGIISRWESGQARPSLDRLEPLAKLLGVSLEKMLGFSTAEEGAIYRAVPVVVWEISINSLPDLNLESSIGRMLVSEDEAEMVDGAFLAKDFFFPPFLMAGDVIGIRWKGQLKVGDIVFARVGNRIVLRRYGGKRKGEVLLPLEISQKKIVVDRPAIIAIYQWVHRPGKIIPNA